MKKHDINFDREPLSSEDIARHQDFDQVLNQYKAAKDPFYKNKWLVSGSLASVLIVILLMTTWDMPGGSSDGLSYVNPPIPQLNVSFASYTIDPGQAQEIEYHTGTIISIPANAFVDQDGKPVSGQVEIQYREMHDAVDFFLSGIPMTYDSAGVQYTFESAGMMEIQGYKDGKPVFVANDKSVNVQMASFQEGYYNVYQLDMEQQNWNLEGSTFAQFQVTEPEDSAELIALMETVEFQQPPLSETPEVQELYQEMKQIEIQIAQVEEERPIEPLKANEERYRFNLDVDESEFPEIALWEGVFFEVSDETNNYDPSLSQFTWEDVQLKEYEGDNNYLVVLSRGDEKHAFLVQPVYKGDTYGTAVSLYEERFAAYEQKLQERKEKEAQVKREYEAKLAQMEADRLQQQREWEAKMEQWKKEQEQAQLVGSKRQQVMRAFTVNNFGVWNCDKPSMLPKGNKVLAQFVDEDNKELDINIVYLVEKGRNAIFSYPIHQKREIRYNPGKDNLLWGVTKDNRLAVFTVEEFAAMEHKPGDYTFKMETAKAQFKDVTAIKEYLNI